MIRRAEVWWADLAAPARAGPGYNRPVIVVQSDDFNRSAIATVVVVAVSSNIRLADLPGNVFLPKALSGLPEDSVANVSQLLTVDRADLTRCARTLPLAVCRDIDRGLKLVLDL